MAPFKRLISPIQRVLLAKGMCVGCSMPLQKAHGIVNLGNAMSRVTCKCGRVYIQDSTADSYRRALMNEA